MWTLLSSLGWRFLPSPGGVLDQPDELMRDVATIEWLSQVIGEQIGNRG